jgi:zinc resistance-associated protein
MRGILIAGLIVLMSAAYSLVNAQQPAATPPGPSSTPTAEDVAALSDARIAELKEGLKIKPDQEKNWATFEGTIRDLAKQRQDRLKQLATSAPSASGQLPSPVDLLRRRADVLSQASADLKRLADAADPLYKTLDDGQKRRMFALLADAVPRR